MARPLNFDVCRKLETMVRTRISRRIGFLPPERKMAEDFGVGRNVIRNCLFELERRGLVKLIPSRGWTLPMPARSRGKRLKRLLILVPFVFHSKAWELQAILSGICCKTSEYFTEAVFSFLDHLTDLNGIVEQVKNGELQGIVFLESVPDLQEYELLRKEGVPCVVANMETDIPGAVCCRMDYADIGYKAGRYLLDAGHRSFAVVSGDTESMIFRDMLAGFRNALAEEKITLPESRIIPAAPDAEEIPALLKLLTAKRRPTAVFAMRDCRAALVYRAAREAGLTTPDDLSLVSYDGLSWPGAAEKGLTSFTEDVKQIADYTVEMLRDWSLSGRIPESKVLPAELVERNSVKKL